jgi:hypothetical protein
MLEKLLGICFHQKITWPQTLRGVTTVSCLECGRTLPYDWDGLGTVAFLTPPVLTQPRRIVIDEGGLRYE